VERTRWRLKDLSEAIEWLKGVSEAGVAQILKRLGFSRKQALAFIRSPDPEYQIKWQAVLRMREQMASQPGEDVLLYMDELTYYRRPSKASAYWQCGHTQPRAWEAPRANTQTRIVAGLNHVTGQVTYLQRSKVGKEALVAFYALVRQAYPQANTIYVVQDNWPIHKSQEVLNAMQENHIVPLFLPTYASWLNPIEKLWRWLKQEVIHLHPFAQAIEVLRKAVLDFLDRFKSASPALLTYTGIAGFNH
jgi:transposase